MVLGVGVDIIEIERVGLAMTGARFCARVFTHKEIAYIQSKSGGANATAAGIFAAKEAVGKALGTGIMHMNWHEIEITRDALGKPEAILSGEILERFADIGGTRVLISISHSLKDAVAYALVEGELK